MRILAVSDEESGYYYDYYKPGNLDGIDLILSAGDLHRGYLDFLVSMAHCPAVYVRGNHDDALTEKPLAGWVCAEDQIVTVQGLRILGLGPRSGPGHQ